MSELPQDYTPITFLIAQPRSGSTLLMRLMNLACGSYMLGDRQPEVYKALLDLDEHHLRGGIFGSVYALERNNVFCDHFNGTGKEIEYARLTGIIKTVLFNAYKASPVHAKSGILGFGNDYLIPFVEMLHKRFSDVKIVYLTRPHEDIVHSFETTDHPAAKNISVIDTLYLLDKQDKQMYSAFNLYGGEIFTYQMLCEQPEMVMRAMRPTGVIDSAKVKEVMAKKLRTPAQ